MKRFSQYSSCSQPRQRVRFVRPAILSIALASTVLPGCTTLKYAFDTPQGGIYAQRQDLLTQAKELEKTFDWDAATELLDQWRTAHPDDTEFAFEHANALASTGRYTHAEEQLKGLARKNPERADLWSARCWNLLMAHKAAEALPVCEHARETGSNNMTTAFRLGHVLLLLGQEQLAHAQYKEGTRLMFAEDVEFQEAINGDVGDLIKAGYDSNQLQRARSWLEEEWHREPLVKQRTHLKALLEIVEGAPPLAPGSEAAPLVARADHVKLELSHYTEPSPYPVGILTDTLAEQLGDAYQYERAIALKARAAEYWRAHWGAEAPEFAALIKRQARLYELAGRYAEAKSLYEHVYALFEKAYGLEHPRLADTLDDIAAVEAKAGHFKDALKTSEQALEMRTLLFGPDNADTGASLNNSARILKALGNYEEAYRRYEKALAIIEKEQEPNAADLSAALNNIANLKNSMGDYSSALSLMLRALSIDEINHGPASIKTAITLNNISLTYKSMGRHQEALNAASRAVNIIENALPPDHPDVAKALDVLAGIQQDLGNFETARKLGRKSLEITKRRLGSNHPVFATALNNAALLHYNLGEFDEAYSMATRALDIARSSLGPEHADTAAVETNLALILSAMGRYELALMHYHHALSIEEEVFGHNSPIIIETVLNLGSIYLTLGDNENAHTYAMRGISIAADSPGRESPLYAQALESEASVLSQSGQIRQALDRQMRSLAIKRNTFGTEHPSVASTLASMAGDYAALDDYEAASHAGKSALAIYEARLGLGHPDTGNALANLGWIELRQGRIQEAIAYFERALDILATRAGEDNRLASAQSGLRESYTRLGEAELAIFFGKQAVNTLQQARGYVSGLGGRLQTRFLDKHRTAYDGLIDLLLMQGRIGEAQEVLQMLKEDEFYESLERGGREDPRTTRIALTGLEEQLFAPYCAMREKQAALIAERRALWQQLQLGTLSAAQQARLDEIDNTVVPTLTKGMRSIFAKLQDELAQARPEPGTLPVDVKAAQTRLTNAIQSLNRDAPESHTVALQFFVADSHVSIILTAPDGPPIARQVTIERDELNALVTRFRIQVGERDADKARLLDTARRLHQVLIAPIAQDLATLNAGTLMLSLHDVLRYIPFAALYDGQHYLIQDHPLALYNEAVAQDMRKAPRSHWRIAAMGLSEGVDNLRALPSVPDELQSVAATGDGAVFLNGEFTRSRLRETLRSDYNILHVASHFEFKQGRAQDSRLYLGDKSRLSLADITDLDLRFDNFDLVTFSACQTAVGGGKDAYGQELESLGAKAQAQGAQAVMASLWQVDDYSTGQLMARFYNHRTKERVNKAQALRAVQVAMIDGQLRRSKEQSWQAPYFWAPFVLMGNWR